MSGTASIGLGLGVVGGVGGYQRHERERRSPSPAHLVEGDESMNASRSSSFSLSDLSELANLSTGSSSSSSSPRLHLSSSPSSSTYASPWMSSGGFSPATPSFSQFPSSHPEVFARATKIRQKKQRRIVNKLAIYLPRPLKPLASSPARLFGTLAAGIVITLLCISVLSLHGASDAKRPAYLPDPAKVHALYRRAIGREPPAFIASYIKPDEHGYEQPHQSSESPLQLTHRSQQLPLGADQSIPGSNNEKQSDEAHSDHDTSISEMEARDGKYAELLDTMQAGHIAETSPQRLSKLEKKVVEVVDKCGSKGCNTCGNRGCDPEGYLRGKDVLRAHEPKALFRDNLRKDLKYLTFGMANGFTNQFLAITNGIYLARLSDRVPVVPPFAASPAMDRHAAGYLSYSKIFDIPRMESLLRSPVIDWESVKLSGELNAGLGKPQNPEMLDEKIRNKVLTEARKHKEKIGCWSLWMAQMPKPGRPAGSAVQNHLGLDIEYWKAPSAYSHPPEDRHIRFWDLVLLDQNIANAKIDHLAEVAKLKREALVKEEGKSVSNKDLSLPPDDHLLCFDTLYYTAATGPQEWWQPHAPVWKAIGRYARWHPEVIHEADRYIRSTLGIEDGLRTSEFVTVHMRRGDFTKWCAKGTSPDDPDDCFPSLQTYKQAIARVREKLLDDRGLYARHVIVTSDDTSPAFQASVKKMGWHVIDHKAMGTASKHGLWWEIVLDAAIQSKGSAFVGTDKSMMSLISGKRVEDWNRGPWELVKWVPGS